jgi:2-(1,2-epoxy-1,2-dihydrophenyl)acetyl-CoA isomerase
MGSRSLPLTNKFRPTNGDQVEIAHAVKPPDSIQVDLNDGLVHVVLSRADKLNALTGEMLDGLLSVFHWAAVDPAARCVLLSADGRAFSVGDDLNGLGPRMGIESDEAECLDSYTHVVSEILRLRKPVVAALHGAVYGAGMEIALACDFRIGDTSTRFGPVYAGHAMAAGTTLLPMFVGVPAARRLLLLADPIGASDALTLGLLDQCVDQGTDLEVASEVAARLAHGPTRAYGLIKGALLQGVGRGPLENLHLEENVAYQASFGHDAQEGKLAFSEKREPSYNGT